MDAVNQIRILIADDHGLHREALGRILRREADFYVLGEAENGWRAEEMAFKLRPDVMLLRLRMPHMSGMDVLRRLSDLAVRIRTLLLADDPEDDEVIEAIKLGARGILSGATTPSSLCKSIRKVAAGEYWFGHKSISCLIGYLRDEAASEKTFHPTAVKNPGLTSRETEIIGTIVEGCANREIAEKFSISEQTVKHHLTSIYAKVGVSNRLELALYAMRQRAAS